MLLFSDEVRMRKCPHHPDAVIDLQALHISRSKNEKKYEYVYLFQQIKYRKTINKNFASL